MCEIKLNIKDLRTKKKWSQGYLGKLLNVSKNTIINWEKDESKIPFGKLILLKKFFQIKIDKLIPDDNGEQNQSNINYEEKYSRNSQTFAGEDSSSKSGSGTMHGNFIGEPKEIHYHQPLTPELIEKITEPYKMSISLLEQKLNERELMIEELKKKLHDQKLKDG